MKTLVIFFSILSSNCVQHQQGERLSEQDVAEYRDIVADSPNYKSETNQSTSAPANEDAQYAHAMNILDSIQAKITAASYDGFAKRDTESLDEIERNLSSSTTGNSNLRKYWIGYVNYYKTIIGLQFKNNELAEKANKRGLEILESIENKNSDDYTLLALIKGLSFSFVSGMEAPNISKDINKTISQAIKADDANFRAYYAQGSVDFYTPKEFGGGTKAEKSLLKAINLPEKNNGNSQLPTWGKEESYDLLICYFLRENKKTEAKKYFDEAKQQFPTSNIIQTHQNKF